MATAYIPLVTPYRRPLLQTLTRIDRGHALLALTIVSGLVQHGGAILAGATSGWLVGSAARATTGTNLVPGLIVLASAVLASSVGTWGAGWFGHAFAFRYQARLRVLLYDGLERAAPRHLFGQRTGDLAAIAMGDIDVLESFFAHLMVNVTVAVAVGATAVIALDLIHPVLAAIAALGMLASAVLPGIVAARTKLGGERLRVELGSLNADAVDGIQGLRELLVFSHAAAFRERLLARTRAYMGLQRDHSVATGLQRAATDGLVSGTTVTVLVSAISLAAHGAISPVAAIVAVTLTAAALAPVTLAIDIAGQLSPLRASAARVLAILDQPTQVPDTAVAQEPIAHPGVRFAGVSFAYDPGVEVLHDASFTVAPGETVALVGHSGAGKSTCANLLLRFWDVGGGSVTLGDRDLREFPLAELRRLVALIPQDVYLFHGTVGDNLRLGHEHVTRAQIEAAARAANAHDFIAALPDGYDTQVGERGARLSGGQRQRLAIARALLHESPVLVMDEAASNLDAENEKAVQEAVRTARAGRTTLVIAHRLSTILSADRIIVLENGTVAETGTHDELVAAGGVYARLIASQHAGVIGSASPA
jgi:ATP-binding cassette, subfamily C, bacterial CydC